MMMKALFSVLGLTAVLAMGAPVTAVEAASAVVPTQVGCALGLQREPVNIEACIGNVYIALNELEQQMEVEGRVSAVKALYWAAKSRYAALQDAVMGLELDPDAKVALQDLQVAMDTAKVAVDGYRSASQ